MNIIQIYCISMQQVGSGHGSARENEKKIKVHQVGPQLSRLHYFICQNIRLVKNVQKPGIFNNMFIGGQ
jgi:hypothetical protein